jgi:hypothetical protein
MPKYAARVDANQNEIVKQLRDVPGLVVVVTSAAGNGFVDIVVIDTITRDAYLVEIKASEKKKLTEAEKELAKSLDYALPWVRIHNAEEFIEIMNEERAE